MFGLLDQTVYSFLDLSGAIFHPLVGSFPLTGHGLGQITIMMDGSKTVHDFGSNGIVLLSKVDGHSGKLIIDCHQTSNMHKWLLHTFQVLSCPDAAADAADAVADAKEWGRMAAILRNIADKTEHNIRGMSFEGVPEKRYQAEGQMVSWTLMAADIRSRAPSNTGAGGLSALAKQFIS